jgi:hypothetical protein
LEAVIEFVRRSYLRGGGGDGAAGIGPGIPPTPEGTPGGFLPGGEEREGHLTEDQGVLKGLLHDAESFSSISNSLKFKATETFDAHFFEASFAQQVTSTTAAQSLAAGVVEIALELLRRFPLSGSDDRIITWFDSAARLGRAITTLGLWRALFAHPWRPELRRAGEDLWARMPNSMHDKLGDYFDFARHGGSYLAIVEALLLQNYSFAGWHPRDFEYWRRRFPFSPYGGSIAPETDPIDDLASWPVSKSLALLAGAPVPAGASVYDILCLIIGSPNVLHRGQPALAERAAALSIFAAAHITATANPVPAFSLMNTELGNAALNRIAGVAARWLANQFPKYVFPRPVEDAIRGASELVYA